MKIAVIYGNNQKGESWIEHVCSTEQEGKKVVEYLNSRTAAIQAMDSPLWKSMGLTFRQRQLVMRLLEEFKLRDAVSRPRYYLSMEDDLVEPQELTTRSEGVRRVQIVNVSPKNRNHTYVHSFVVVDDSSVNNVHSDRIYKVTLNEPAEPGSFHDLDFSEFKIVKRSSGYQYQDIQNSPNTIRRDEWWVFFKRPDDQSNSDI